MIPPIIKPKKNTTQKSIRMPSCTRLEGIPSTCRNKIINPVTNRLIQCQACKDHSRAIQVLQKRAATKRAPHCRQAAFNLNRVINLDLRTEDSDLRQALDGEGTFPSQIHLTFSNPSQLLCNSSMLLKSFSKRKPSQCLLKSKCWKIFNLLKWKYLLSSFSNGVYVLHQ